MVGRFDGTSGEQVGHGFINHIAIKNAQGEEGLEECHAHVAQVQLHAEHGQADQGVVGDAVGKTLQHGSVKEQGGIAAEQE